MGISTFPNIPRIHKIGRLFVGNRQSGARLFSDASLLRFRFRSTKDTVANLLSNAINMFSGSEPCQNAKIIGDLEAIGELNNSEEYLDGAKSNI